MVLIQKMVFDRKSGFLSLQPRSMAARIFLPPTTRGITVSELLLFETVQNEFSFTPVHWRSERSYETVAFNCPGDFV